MKKPFTKGHLLYGFIYMKQLEEANPQSQKDEWWSGAGKIKGNGGHRDSFRMMKTFQNWYGDGCTTLNRLKVIKSDTFNG